MSEHERISGQDNTPTQEQIPHSGVHGFEQPPERQFDRTSLQEAHEQGRLTVPESPRDLAIHTAEVNAPFWTKGKQIIVGGVAVLAASATVFAVSQSGETGKDTRTQPSASAPAVPGETASVNPENVSQTESIGIRLDTFENLNVKPDQAVIDRAKEITPDTLSSYDALIDLSRKSNVYLLSGELQDTQGEQFETPESQQNGNEIIANMFGSSITPLARENTLELRKSIALRTNYYGPDKTLDVETGDMVYATYNVSLSDIVLVSETDTSATYNATRVYNTNYEAVDRDDVFDNPGVGYNLAVPSQITIVKEGGNWLYSSVEKTE